LRLLVLGKALREGKGIRTWRNGMAEKYLKCPSCGAGNPEGKMFCGDCGTSLPQPPPPPVQPMQPVYAQPKPNWIRSNWKGLVSVVVVLLFVLSIVGLVYSQPWSKIKVLVTHSDYISIGVMVYIDGVLKASVGANAGTSIVGVWPVVAGSHTVEIDSGHSTLIPGYWYVVTHWFSPDEYFWVPDSREVVAPDGAIDFTYTYSVGPLYTKNVYITLS